ncbi:MAG TPA: ParB/RepB/Spo0J family partition protein [Ignavibacteriaceae bacterium]|jgi:ParB family chromosome partitioning protein|nr:ParB/RepB/Spo0J family partition protein [Ignavibacteriaceae bacterium]
MSKIRPPVLGRGLDALIRPQAKNETIISEQAVNAEFNNHPETEVITKIPVSDIFPNPFQPRLTFDTDAMEELKKSILTNGLIQPITVRRYHGEKYQLISGERRLKAFKEIGYKTIPAYILDVVSDEIMLAMALIENIQRERLNPIEVGLAYKRLMEECNLSHEQIAERVGKDRSTVANSIRLLKLPEEVKEALITDSISMGHARALINVNDNAVQVEILNRIKENNLSVRKVEQLVKKYLTGDSGKRTVQSSGISFKNKNADLSALEDRLRRLFGTKIICRQTSSGSGEIVVEFYSADELERLIELFEIIEKNNY